MKILNFDTSLDKTYIALSQDGVILKSVIIENTNEKYHSAFLIPELAKILREFGIEVKDLDYIATNVGPGSFTGIRAGLTVARTLCQQANVKAVGFTSLEILSKINDTNKTSLVILDARKNMVYVQEISSSNVVIKEPCAVLIEDVVKKIKTGDYFVICDDKIAEIFAAENINCVNYQSGKYDLAVFLNNLAYDFVSKNNNYDYNWAKLKPLYIQPPPVTLKK